MTDIKDTSTHHDDDEFQFDEFDTPEDAANQGEASAAGATAQAKMDWQNGIGQKNPRKLIAFGAIVLIIIIFIVYHFASSWNNPLDDLGKTSRAVVPAHQATVKVQQPVQASVVPVDTEMDNKVNSLEQSLNQQGQTIDQLQTTMSSLQDNINAVGTTVTTVSQQLDAINTQLTKPKKVAKPADMGPPPIKYIVKAMVPGRAWLQASDGSTLSVSVGSDVPQHGSVTQMDLSGGQVLMSDGSIITYDINGN